MKVRFLGGAREVGRSAILVNDRLLLDYGMLTGNPPQFPVATPDPEAVVVSHGHLDHVGAIPSLLSGDRRPPIHWTPPPRELALTLARDTLKLHGGTYDCPFTEEEVRRVTQVSATHGYRETFETAGHEVTFYNAGHIPGSAHVLVDDGDTRLFYTADFHTEEQRLVSASTARPDADVVVCESTYADVEHEPRERIEAQFVESLRTTVWEGGHRRRPRVRHRPDPGDADDLCRPRRRLLRRRHGQTGDEDAPPTPRIRSGRRRAPTGEVERSVPHRPRRPANTYRRPEHGHRDDQRDAL